MKLHAEQLISQIGLSVRALNVCVNLNCETVGDLVDIFQKKGEDFVISRRNCGKKTLAELSKVVGEISGETHPAQFALCDTSDDLAREGEAFSGESLRANPLALLEAIESLQIPYGFPIELIRLSARIRNWCIRCEWRTLGALLHNAGGMGFCDIRAAENLGTKSARELLDLFDAIMRRSQADIRRFLPIAPNTTFVALSQALKDLMTSRDARDLRILEMRLVEGFQLEAIGRHYNCTRELVRQIEAHFLREVECILGWFSEERVGLWQKWENSDDLSSGLAEREIAFGASLLSASISSLFANSPEGKLLQKHWEEIFRNWGRELIACESLFSEGICLAEFAQNRGNQYLMSRFQSWLEKHFGDSLSVIERKVTRSRRELTPQERKLLYGIESRDARWSDFYQRLVSYHTEHGHANVPCNWESDRPLGVWVGNQRERRKMGNMSDEEFALFEQLGFTWQTRERSTWEDRLAELTAFRVHHGHCEVPTVLPDNPKLGRFVQSIRARRNMGILSDTRIAQLDAIGFVWSLRNTAEVKIGDHIVNEAWKVRYDELVAYKESHGDCEIPATWEENQQLANWMGYQRQMKKRGELPEARIQLLDEIGFIWQAGTVQKSWEARYAELLQYKETHGHCDVPVRNSKNSSLGAWALRQRNKKKKGELLLEQIQLLDEVSFRWQNSATLHGRTVRE
jgi:hypothetical protein